MKILSVLFMASLFLFTSCDSDGTLETNNSLIEVDQFTGLFSGTLASNDGDFQDQILVLEIGRNDVGGYDVTFITDEATKIFTTNAKKGQDKLTFGWETVETPEAEQFSINYTLEYIDETTLNFEMKHKLESEGIEYDVTGKMIKE